MNGEPATEIIKKKRGRKKKEVAPLSNNITIIIEETVEEHTPAPEQPAKKRGRKPKGGKLITKPPEKKDFAKPVTNIILHLKCSMQDLVEHNTQLNKIVTDPLTYNPNIPPSIMTYNSDETTTFSTYKSNEVNQGDNNTEEILQMAYTELDKSKLTSSSSCSNVCQRCSSQNNNAEPEEEDDDINIKEVNSKLKKLKLQLYKNSNPDKKSACFWCTYEYDNPSCYIPKYEMDDQFYGYGSFCRPECAVAYLMKENLDDSTKFERYHLLNQIYSKVYNYKKNIKPAPNPYFLLDKFYGNLSIQEYRKLLKTEHMLLVIDKPMTRILPELHEDSEDFIMNIYGGKVANQPNTTGVYKVKKQSEKQKGPSKNSIMKENFGIQ